MSSLEKAFWCAQLLRCSRSSLTRLRSAWPSVLRNTSFQVSHHQFQQAGYVPLRDRLTGQLRILGKASHCLHVDGAILHGLVDFALDEGREAGFQKLQGLGDPFLVGDGHGSPHDEHFGLRRGGCRWTFAREPHDLGPALDEAVVGERFRRALLVVGRVVEPVGEFASDLGLAAELRDERRRRALAAGAERADRADGRPPRRSGACRRPDPSRRAVRQDGAAAPCRAWIRGCRPRRGRRCWCSWPC